MDALPRGGRGADAPIGLARLFAALIAPVVVSPALSGCCCDSTCGCEGRTIERVEVVTVPGATFAEVDLDPAGRLTAEDCQRFCRGWWGRTSSCRDLGPVLEASSPLTLPPASAPPWSSVAGPAGSFDKATGGTSGAGGMSNGGAGGMSNGGAGGMSNGGAEGHGGDGPAPTEPPADHRVECFVSYFDACEGRRHAAVPSGRAASGPDEAAAWLVRAAAAEAGSVPAFRLLRDELRQHGAPERLGRAACRAAGDEVRHTRTMRAFARRSGALADASWPPVSAPRRSLLDLAVENAVEGCVRETWAGLVAAHQAAHAAEPELAAAMAAIARDEAEHGELAWAIHRWALEQLDEAGRRVVERALRDAAAELVQAVGRDGLAESTRVRLGLPAPARAAELAERVRSRLWS